MTRPGLQKDVVIVGAGPYGLSAAAHLQAAGVDPYVIGQPMAFWKQSMPKGMLLRSRVEASNIDAPQKPLSIFGYQRAIRRKLAEPLPIEDFIAYGEWLQAKVASNVDRRVVKNISPRNGGFEIGLEDGERISARSVVLALGIGPFLYRPEPFDSISRELAPHSSDLGDASLFRGKRVAVVGKGQSALEYAALLHESGADVQIITRAPGVAFRPFAWRKHLFRTLTPGPLRGISYRILPPTDLGDIKTARKMANPDTFRRQPPGVQEALLKDCARPVGAYWLPSRLEGVRVRTEVTVSRADVVADRVNVVLSDGSAETFDRVVLATGYKIDVSKYQLLDESLRRQIQKSADGYPVLTTGLQTSVTGLYMAGVVGEKALGPTLRFVTGTSNAGPRLAAAITGKGRLR